MKAALLILAALLAGCGRGDNRHADLLERGCVFKSRGTVAQSCGKTGCQDVKGTVYSCPAYEAKVRDWE